MTFNGVKKFIDKKKCRPTNKTNPSFAAWISHQVQNHKNKKDLMKVQKIYDEWTEFINSTEYSIYFKSLDDEWYKMFEQLKEFIDDNQDLPKRSNGSIGNWLHSQKANYRSKQNALADSVKYLKWSEFINSHEYAIYFKSLDEIWNENFDILKKYIDKNKSIPKPSNKQLYNWLNTQKSNYKAKECGMANPSRYDLWTEFVESNVYSNYFI